LNYEQIRINYSGGFLTLIFSGIGALGALLGGEAAIANFAIDPKRKYDDEEKIKRHSKDMEKIVKNAKILIIDLV